MEIFFSISSFLIFELDFRSVNLFAKEILTLASLARIAETKIAERLHLSYYMLQPVSPRYGSHALLHNSLEEIKKPKLSLQHNEGD